MADGVAEPQVVTQEHDQAAHEAPQQVNELQSGQREQLEGNEQNGAAGDVPVPGTEPAVPTAPAPHSATLIQEYVKLFAGSIPKTFTEADIKPLFDEYGEVLETVLIKNKTTGTSQGCAFIKYKTVEEAEKAITGLHNIKQLPGGNGPIQVRYADGERERLGNVEHKLFVGNMNKTATEDEITEVFKSYGNIEDLYVMRGPDKVSRGCCFVKYSTRDSALAAIKTLNGAQTVLNGEYPLAVRFADTKRRGEREDGRAAREAPYAAVSRAPAARAPPPQYGGPYAAPVRGPPYGGRGYPPPAFQPSPYAPPHQPPYYQPPVQQPQYPPPQPYQLPPISYAPPPPAGAPPGAVPEWTEHTSPEGYKYYYNGKTGQSSWEKPEGMDGPPQPPARSSVQYPPAAPAPVASDWTEHTSPEGLKYYFNGKTGQSSWEKPAEMSAPVAVQPQYPAPQYSAPAQQYPPPQAAAYQPPAQPLYLPGTGAPPPAGGKPQYQHQNGPSGANLFIFRIPDDFDDDKLLQTFLPFGKVIHAKVGMDRDTGKSKGFGFVSYDNVESAEAAIQSLNGITLGGKRLKVEKKRGEDGASGAYKPY